MIFVRRCAARDCLVCLRCDVIIYRHNSEKQKLLADIDSLKELIATFEKTVERKDQIVENLTDGIKRHRDKYDMMRKFCEWRMNHNDNKREVNQRACASLCRQMRVESWEPVISV